MPYPSVYCCAGINKYPLVENYLIGIGHFESTKARLNVEQIECRC